jgi:hypothetical protein
LREREPASFLAREYNRVNESANRFVKAFWVPGWI